MGPKGPDGFKGHKGDIGEVVSSFTCLINLTVDDTYSVAILCD